MKHYAGLDVSVKETAICIVDESGLICRETKVVSHPEDLSKVLMETGFRIERIGLEAGPLSQWLFEIEDAPSIRPPFDNLKLDIVKRAVILFDRRQ